MVLIPKYMNANIGETEGIEAKVEAKPCRYLSLGAAYTYANAKYKEKDTSDWARANYWPMNTLAFVGTLYPVDKLTVSFKMTWEGDKIVPLFDSSYNQVLWHESGNVRLDMTTTYKLVKNYRRVSDVDLFLRIENLLDEDYTESGNGMPGRWVYGGIRMTF